MKASPRTSTCSLARATSSSTSRKFGLDATIAVVHKHRIGSCKEHLVATPQGLRYETDDKDDRFSLPLSDIEVFEVDYLAKVLRVKLAKGKRTNSRIPAPPTRTACSSSTATSRKCASA